MFPTKFDANPDKQKLAAQWKPQFEKFDAADRERAAKWRATHASLDAEELSSSDDDVEWEAKPEDYAAVEFDNKAKFAPGVGFTPRGHMDPLADRVPAHIVDRYKRGTLPWCSSPGPNPKVFAYTHDAVCALDADTGRPLNPLHQTRENVLLFAHKVWVDDNCGVWLGWPGTDVYVAKFADPDQANAVADALRMSMAMRTAWYALYKASRAGGVFAGIARAFIEAEETALFYLHPLTVSKRGTLFFDAGTPDHVAMLAKIVAAHNETARASKFEAMLLSVPAVPKQAQRDAFTVWKEYRYKQLRQEAEDDEKKGVPVKYGEKMKAVWQEVGEDISSDSAV